MARVEAGGHQGPQTLTSLAPWTIGGGLGSEHISHTDARGKGLFVDTAVHNLQSYQVRVLLDMSLPIPGGTKPLE